MNMIEELANVIAHACPDLVESSCGDCGCVSCLATNLYNNGVILATDNSIYDTCDYCQEFDDPCGVPMIAEEDSEPGRGIYLYNGFLCANGGEFCEAKVNFCPMCGRKLT